MLAFRLFASVLVGLVAFAAHATVPKATLKPFASEAELQALLKTWAERNPLRRAEQMAGALQSAPAAPASKAAESAADRSPTCSTPASTRAASSSCTATTS